MKTISNILLPMALLSIACLLFFTGCTNQAGVEKAEKVYRENLSEIPDNGWALFGLHQALLKQNKPEEAAEVEKRFKESWKYSDIQLTSSRIL